MRVVVSQQTILHFSLEMEMLSITYGEASSYIKGVSAVKRVEFISDRMSYTILRGWW
jgi:hypothetical protein